MDHDGTLEEALAAVRASVYALVLLDLRLPDGEGLALLRDLRDLRDRRDPTPVLIATARDRITERIVGFEAGPTTVWSSLVTRTRCWPASMRSYGGQMARR